MVGAGVSPGGGVDGADLVSIVEIFAVRGLSGDDVPEPGSDDVCLSGKILPNLDATLPRLLFVPTVLSFDAMETTASLAALRSGLVLGLPPPRLGVRACLNLPTGDGDLLPDPLEGGISVASTSDGVEVEVARASTDLGKVAARGVLPSNCASCKGVSGRLVECINGEVIVR
jgi:hypothetical protein